MLYTYVYHPRLVTLVQGGEYVALERMNTAYNNSPFVNVETGGVCSYAGDELDRAVCLAQCKVRLRISSVMLWGELEFNSSQC